MSLRRLYFDTETDGLLPELTAIHCLVLHDLDTGQIVQCSDTRIEGITHTLAEGLALLADADLIVGHNVIKFDIPVILKLYPMWTTRALVRDTIVLSRLIWPDIKKQLDFKLLKQKRLPRNMLGKHSLEAFGHRLGNPKAKYDGGWKTFTKEMLDYCVQDTDTGVSLWEKCESRNYSAEAIELEHDVAWIIARQERYGVGFNRAKAVTLLTLLAKRRAEVEAELALCFPPWELRTPFTPKANNKARGYQKGVPTFKVKVITFNPGSLDHVADRLSTLYGWKPEAFTNGGKPQVDEKVLGALGYPAAKPLMEYFLLAKRIGQVANGKEAWLRHEIDGVLHGGVITNGAVTGRMTHKRIANIPKVGSAFGAECRECFEARKGKVLVGIDAAGIELRLLGHFAFRYDDGRIARAVSEGSQEAGTDVHTLNCIALGMDPKKVYVISGKQQKGRDCAKTFIYAFLYGAGDEKIGVILGVDSKEGRRYKVLFLSKSPGIKGLKKAVEDRVKQLGSINGLDKRALPIRSSHAALNTLLQSAGAVVMKKALVLFERSLVASGYSHQCDYEFVLNVHDEWQVETRPEIAEHVGTLGVQAIRDAGAHFGLRCPLDGEFKIGANWKETH